MALRVEHVHRGGLAALGSHVDLTGSHHTAPGATCARSSTRPLPRRAGARDLTLAAFERLAVAGGHRHGTDPETVHFHEVGALDAIADVVSVCAGFDAPSGHAGDGLPQPVGSGTVRTTHGVLPVPPPAVAELLRGAPTHAARWPMGCARRRAMPRC